MRVEGVVFGEKNTHQQGRVDVLLVRLLHDRISDAESESAVVGILVQYFTDAERLFGRLRSVNDSRGQSQHATRIRVQRVLLGNRPDRATSEQADQRNRVAAVRIADFI